MTKALEIVKNKLIFLEDELQHYTMVEKDAAKAYLIQCDIDDLEKVYKELQMLDIITTYWEVTPTRITYKKSSPMCGIPSEAQKIIREVIEYEK